MQRLQAAVPGGRRLQDDLQFDRLRAAEHRRGDPHPDRGVHPGGDRRLPVPGQCPRHADPADRGAGVADRHVRRHAGAGLLARTWSRCWRWCWRSASWSTMPSSWSRRSRPIWRPTTASRPPDAAKRAMGQITAPDPRDHAGAAVGVRAGGVHPGHLGPALPAVRGGGRRLDGDLGDQRADPVAGPVRGAAAPPSRPQARPDPLRAGRDRLGARRLCRDRQAAGAGGRIQPRRGRRVPRAQCLAVQGDPRRLPAVGGPGRVLRRGAAARGRLGQPHGRGGRADREASSRTSRASPTSARSSATARWMGSASPTAPTSSCCSSRSTSAPARART